MKKLLSFCLIVANLIALPAYALDLQEARAKGMVGETAAGYVARVNGGGEVSALVSEVNLKRREEYERIAKEKGQPVDVVAKLAAGQIISALPAGSLYKDAKGGWVKR